MARAYVPVTWRLSEDLYRDLKDAARASGKSVQSFAEEALRRAIIETLPAQDEDVWVGIIGGGEGGPADVAVQHDHYLGEAYAGGKGEEQENPRK